MADWTAELDYPEPHWTQLRVHEPDAAEQAARIVAERGGSESETYALALLPELRSIVDQARQRAAAPVLVLLPFVPQDSSPLVPATAYVAAVDCPEEERTLEAVAEAFRERRRFVVGKPDIRPADLPAGPACRVQEMTAVDDEEEPGRRLLMEHVSFYVLAPGFTGGFVELTVTWAGPAAGEEMAAFADELAATLRVTPAGGAEAEAGGPGPYARDLAAPRRN